MKVYLIHDEYNEEHLQEVKKQMQSLGAPQIKVIYLGADEYAALEGCHRLRAAAELGITPEFIELSRANVGELDVIDPSLGLDVDNPGMTVNQMISDCYVRDYVSF